MGDVVQFRDFQSKDAIERAHKALEEHMSQQASIENTAASVALFGNPVGFPLEYTPTKYWPSNYRAEDKDPA